ncbi:histidine kinase [Massilia forsythiae]|uniref:Histidine kinase n=1 Tax=Massilia forsythiae TaxID=2728020 RepID=A0A7Z2VTD2_9BURK|nr:cache domain-containing protein [Massilia forsythiae]QJD98656.1 histidine kinase [Massilia forsythiae]
MKLRQKFLFLAIAPLIAALCAIALFVWRQADTLARQQRATIERVYLASKEAELRHYVELAAHAIAHLTASGRGDAATLGEARRILASLGFGDDGYFFVYDMNGRNLMHPRQPELEGRDLWNLRDAYGAPTVQNLVAVARRGGGLVRYNWVKPSTGKSAPKLGYVVTIPSWGWIVGSGLYLDDVDAALRQVDAQQSGNIAVTMLWIAAVATLSALAVACAGLALNVSESRTADAKLKALAQRVVDTQEGERARLARDLHDGISQWLVSIKLQIEAGIIRMQGDAAQRIQAQAGFERTAEALNEVLGEVRRISHGLRPTLLDDLGLAAALQHLAHEFAQHSGVPVAFSAAGSLERLPAAAGTALFRIAQEALTNIERHAGARRIELALAGDDGRVLLRIADDGAGFDADDVATHPQRGIGLRNMAERLDAVGGVLDITSSGAGTTVRASVAFKEAA